MKKQLFLGLVLMGSIIGVNSIEAKTTMIYYSQKDIKKYGRDGLQKKCNQSALKIGGQSSGYLFFDPKGITSCSFNSPLRRFRR